MTKPTGKKPGRPAREGGPRTTESFRVDRAEWALIEAAAAAKGMPAREWIRDTLLRAARRTGR